MTDTIYIESDLLGHPRAQSVLQRYPHARIIPCDHYGEVFNPKAQSFRLQKNNPALIIARKHNKHVLAAPDGYGIGGDRNYYFSHMLNCVYDCRYCFLQGMYRSAHWVWFINYEDFADEIKQTLTANKQPCWFFSGYDCDSLAYEPTTGFIEYFLPLFAEHQTAHLEIRTKSTQIRSLLNNQPLPNVVVAFSFTPEKIANKLEHGVPAIKKRINAMLKLARAGWQIGLRFDPLIYWRDYKSHYQALFSEIFAKLDDSALHSVSLGAFRLPKPFFDNMVKLYPEEVLFAGNLTDKAKMVSYPEQQEQEIIDFCTNELARYVPEEKFFPCYFD